MPTVSRLAFAARASLAARAVAAALVAATLLTLAPAPAPAAALEPPRPLPGYRAEFVSQTDRGPSKNCLWASAAMLLDKWTNGHRTVSHQRLRALSGDRRGGSNFDDLKIAYRKLGFRLEFSPDGGEKITWRGLLRRLRHGAGAVILGNYSRLPRWYGRWDYGFWRLTKKEKAREDNHAMYIERYDARRGRVWLMDPLAPKGWRGEWISVRSLRRFAWTRGGALFVAVTPTAKAAPFAGVRIAARPKLTQTATTLGAAWALDAPKRWRFPGVTLRVAMKPTDDPLLAAVTSPAVVVKVASSPDGPGESSAGAEGRRQGATTEPTDEPPLASVTSSATSAKGGSSPDGPREPTIGVGGRWLSVTTPLPDVPGAYVASIRSTDRRLGRTVVEAHNIAVFVPGARQARLRLGQVARELAAGQRLTVSVAVTNSGTLPWSENSARDRRSGIDTPRDTRLVASWILLEAADGSDDEEAVDAAAKPVALGAVSLAPRERRTVRAEIVTPSLPGRWALVIDVVDDVDGSFAALGSAPAVAIVEVRPPEPAPAD